ncbi:hypothetical protein SDC9_155145 [bioreactor metagenome]|uniref:Amidohydrolase-related domain-containing protein n=1 Tax=bioreactor metagenome TaxID=1076179 RepID=A0A645F5P3_9ZZZZ
MFIDIHAHITYGDCPELAAGILGRPPFDIGVLLRRMDLEGIEKSVLLPLVNAEVLDRYGVAGNQEVLRAARRYPDRIIPFCGVDPRSMLAWGRPGEPGSFRKLLEIYRDLGCRGIGEVCGSIPVDDERYQALYAAAGEFKMPLVFHFQRPGGHTYGATDIFHLPGLERMLAQFPETVFLGHSMAFWSEISGDVTETESEGYLKGRYTKKGRLWELFAKYPNLGGDISAGSGALGISCDPEHGAEFLETFRHQLYFGTDRFTAEDEPIPPQIPLLNNWRQEGKISAEAYELIAHKNAEKLLGL